MTDDDKKAIEHLSERIVQNGQDSFQVIQQLIDSHPVSKYDIQTP